MSRPRRRNCLWLLLLAVIGVLLLLLPVYEFSRYNYELVQLTYDRTGVDQPHAVEQVKVSDVLSVEHFISASRSVRAFDFYQFNNKLSDKIGAFRALPDTRDAVCAERAFYLPPPSRSKVSVVIAFHNEARSALIRTVAALCRRTPAKYLHELILVDDHSEDATLLPALRQLDSPPFSDNSSASPAIKMQRNTRRLGVIESRNLGARLATGDYLFFLDSHCEVNVGWLEPLLERVAAGVRWRHGSLTAVSPVLDSIDARTLEYRASSKRLMGGFDWNLHFHWVRRGQGLTEAAVEGEADETAFKSPTFAGGIFMISRNWFFKLNAFNSLLEIWGGESIEFSIKLWLCGGQIEIVPCSRVGHIFRQRHPFHFPHGSDGQATYLRNSKIIAESWLDAYKHFFYASRPAAKEVAANISQAAVDKLKRDLQCRPFAWYLQNVYTELKLPNDDFIAFGTLSSAELCLQILQPLTPGTAHLQMASCYSADVTHWYLHRHSARLYSNSGACLNVVQLGNHTEPPATVLAPKHFAVALQYCRSSAQTQRWQRRGSQLIHEQTHLCLDNPLGDVVTVSHCRRAAPTQLFRFSMELQQL